jgi:hypothetical protein
MEVDTADYAFLTVSGGITAVAFSCRLQTQIACRGAISASLEEGDWSRNNNTAEGGQCPASLEKM